MLFSRRNTLYIFQYTSSPSHEQLHAFNYLAKSTTYEKTYRTQIVSSSSLYTKIALNTFMDLRSTAVGNGIKLRSTAVGNGIQLRSTAVGNGIQLRSTAVGNGIKLRSTAVGNGIKLQHPNPGMISIQSPTDHP